MAVKLLNRVRISLPFLLILLSAFRLSPLGSVNLNALRLIHNLPVDKVSLTQAATIYPHSLFILALDSYYKGDYETSEYFLEKVAKDNQRSSIAYWWLGQGYLRQEKYEKAVELFQLAGAGVWFRDQCSSLTESFVLGRSSDIEYAIRSCELALDITKSDLYIARSLASLYQKQGNLDKAADFYIRASAVENDPFVRLVLYGHGLQIKREWQKAVEAYSEAVNLNPADSGPYFEIGFILFNSLEQPTQAREQFAHALSINPEDALVNYWIGRVDLELGNYDSAFDYSSKAVELSPENPRYLLQRGDCAFALQDYELARLDYQKVLVLEPGNSYAKNKLESLIDK